MNIIIYASLFLKFSNEYLFSQFALIKRTALKKLCTASKQLFVKYKFLYVWVRFANEVAYIYSQLVF